IPHALRRKPDCPRSLYGRCGGSRDRRRHRGGYQATDFRLRRRSLARGHHSQLAYTSGLLRRSAARSGPRPRRAGTRPTQSGVRSPLEKELIVTNVSGNRMILSHKEETTMTNYDYFTAFMKLKNEVLGHAMLRIGLGLDFLAQRAGPNW